MYTLKLETAAKTRVVADDMILTKGVATAAGSKMLEGFESLFSSEALTRLENAGYGLCGKSKVGEFALDLMGETAFDGALTVDGVLKNGAAEVILAKEADIALCLDVNGSCRRAAAQTGLVSIKPTYGTVSRYGTVPVACSGETVSLLAESVEAVREALAVVVGHDDKDGTSQPETLCEGVLKNDGTVKKVAVLKNMCASIDADVKANIEAAIETLKKNGIEVQEIDGGNITAAKVAWNILMCAEMCNNVSRYDGVKYGHRAEEFSNLDELYINSRTEGFGSFLKTAIIFGSETLSTDNYMKVYDKALRTRRIIVDEFNKIFGEFDAVLMPAVSKSAYTLTDVENDKYMAFNENFYTAPASISGLPAVVAGGVQLVGKAFCENKLLTAAEILVKEGK